jgi:hypothetical protein
MRRVRKVPVRVVACLMMITVAAGMLATPTVVAQAADVGPEAAAQQAAAQQVTEAVRWAQESRASAAAQLAAGYRVAAAIEAGQRARESANTARRERAERATRDAVRSALPGCDTAAPVATFGNGQWPDTALCALPGGGHFLRPQAAEAFVRLSFDYARVFGGPPCLTDSYRSLAGQRRVARTKPRLAARAGTSTHGDGVAVDLCGGAESYGTPQYGWLREHGPRYGWDNPDWARAEGSRPEAWHWEYTG